MPQPFDALRGREQSVVALHGVQDQSLVGLEDIAFQTGVMHRELQTQLVELHTRARALAVEGQGHLGGVGEVEGQVVRPVRGHPGPVREHRLRRLLERDRHDAATLCQAFARTQVEGHIGPPPVVDGGLHRDEGLRLGDGVHSVDVAVPGVLAAHHIIGIDRLHAVEDLVLLHADGIRLEGSRRFHGDEGHDLEEVRHHHVPVGAGALVEGGTLLQPQGLGDVDLDVVDEVAVPDRLEQAVGEAEGQDVEGRLLAQEVVDPEDLLLGEDLMDLVVQFLRRLQVRAERLLHDHLGVLDQIRLGDGPDGRQRGGRRHRQVVEPLRALGKVGLGPGHRLGEGGRPRADRDVVEDVAVGLPLLLGEVAGVELVE